MTFDSNERSIDSGEPIECYLFKTGPSTYALTSSDAPADLFLDGAWVTFTPAAIRRDGSSYSQETDSGSIIVHLDIQHAISEMFIGASPAEPVTLTMYRFHDSESDWVLAFVGSVVSVSMDGAEAALTCATALSRMKRNLPRLNVQRTCNWALYSPRCGVSKAAFKATGTVAEINGLTLRSTVFAAKPSGWYSGGWVETVLGVRRFIVSHVGDTVTLQAPFMALALNESVDAYAGCKKDEATCASKFSNLPNFLGFSHLPLDNPHETGLD